MLSALRLTQINLYKHVFTVNFWTPFILALAAVTEFAEPLRNITIDYKTPINGFSAAFLWSSSTTVFIVFLGMFILFSDLPFKDNQQMFLISRSGKRAWIFSQVFYVIFVSVIYFAFIFVCYIANLIPRINFSADKWGKVMNSAPGLQQKYLIKFTTSSDVLNLFSPLEGFLYTFGAAIIAGIILGLITLFFNLTFKRNSGVILSGTFVFLYMFASFKANGFAMYYFSPLNWLSIDFVDKKGVSGMPDLWWCKIMFGIIVAILIAALFIYGGRRIKFEMDTKEEGLQ